MVKKDEYNESVFNVNEMLSTLDMVAYFYIETDTLNIYHHLINASDLMLDL